MDIDICTDTQVAVEGPTTIPPLDHAPRPLGRVVSVSTL